MFKKSAEHRKYDRFNTTFAATAFDSHKHRHSLEVTNISGGGLGVLMKGVIFPVGTTLTVHLKWNASMHPIMAEVDVRWLRTSKGSGSCNGGLEFTKISDMDRNCIIKYVNSQQAVRTTLKSIPKLQTKTIPF